MKLKFLILTFLFGISAKSFSQPDYWKKFLNCGFPKLSDYKCFNYDTIKKSQNPIFLKKSDNYNSYTLNKRLRNRFKLMRTTSFLVVQNDKIIYEKYWLKYTEDSVMNSFSVAKSIVAILLGIAIDQGKINSIDDKVYSYLPWFNQGKDTLLTIKDLLSMSSGLSWEEEFTNPFSDIAQAYYGEHLDSLIKSSHVMTTPGKTWDYQCGNTVLIALIIEKATGMPLPAYAEKYLWQPLGASDDAYWGKSGNVTKAFCCFYATARDFAKLGLLVLHNGKFNGRQIVSAGYIKEVIKPAKWLTYGKKNKSVDFYGLHFWLIKYNNKYYPYFSGMFGQYIIILPEYNAVVVRTGEMVNELKILPVPPDIKYYLKAAIKIIKNNKTK